MKSIRRLPFMLRAASAAAAAALLARLDKLNAQFEKAFAKTGVTAVSPYPTAWTYAY